MKKYVVYVVVLGILCVVVGFGAGLTVARNVRHKHLSCVQGRRQAAIGMLGERLSQHRQKKGSPDRYGKIPQGPGEEKGAILGKIVKELELTEKQKEQVKEILESTRQTITSLRGDFQAKIKDAREESRKKILAVLTPSQQEEFEAMIQKERSQRRL